MKKLILTRGLPGSGKSTWAKEQLHKYPGRYKRVNRDSLRLMFDDEQFNPKREKFISKTQRLLILIALEEGFHVIVDDCNLNNKYVKAFKDLVKGIAEVEIKDFTDVPVEECIKRDLNRLASVGKDVIMRMYNDNLVEKKKYKKPVFNDNLPMAIICDLDGTLSKMVSRGPFDWKKCIEDELNQPVADLLYNYDWINNYRIFLFSGRSDVAKPETIEWLEKHKIPYNLLDMRKDGDNRKDTIVKQEMYERHVKGKYNISFVLDDRDMMVKHWRDLGLTCLQVDYGNF